jgi:hypothetical protein
LVPLPPPPTEAVFVSIPEAPRLMLAPTVIDGYEPLPLSASERVQVTVCDAMLHDQPLPVADVGVSPLGSVSVTVTVPLDGVEDVFVTVRENELLPPCGHVPVDVLAMVSTTGGASRFSSYTFVVALFTTR